jgi:hypothetical protein
MSIQFKPKLKDDDEDASTEELYDAWTETFRYFSQQGNIEGIEKYLKLIASLDVELAKQGEP